MKHLIIDDNRTLQMVVAATDDKSYFDNQWDIVRTYEDFKNYLHLNGLPDMISFDHDLADFKDGEERTGKTCAQYLVEYCLDRDIKLTSEYKVHSSNPRGVENIEKYLDNFKKFQEMEANHD